LGSFHVRQAPILQIFKGTPPQIYDGRPGVDAWRRVLLVALALALGMAPVASTPHDLLLFRNFESRMFTARLPCDSLLSSHGIPYSTSTIRNPQSVRHCSQAVLHNPFRKNIPQKQIRTTRGLRVCAICKRMCLWIGMVAVWRRGGVAVWRVSEARVPSAVKSGA
jgi:hypothetical protein